MHANCPSCLIEGVLPVRVSQIGANCAGGVDFLSVGCFVLGLTFLHRLYVQPLIGGVGRLDTTVVDCYGKPISKIYR